MDILATAAVPGGVAVLSSLLTVLVVGVLTAGRLRAEERIAAQRAVRDVVLPLLRDVERYRRGRQGNLGRDDTSAHAEDAVWAARVHGAALGLGWWRTRVLNRRCRRIFGRRLDALGRDFSDKPDEANASTQLVMEMLRSPGKKAPTLLDGLLQRGLAAKGESPVTRKLARQLRRLANTWLV